MRTGIIVFGVMFVAGIAISAYLVMNGHPWFGLAVLIVTSLLSYHSDDKKEE